jgi:hypothetical protein
LPWAGQLKSIRMHHAKCPKKKVSYHDIKYEYFWQHWYFLLNGYNAIFEQLFFCTTSNSGRSTSVHGLKYCIQQIYSLHKWLLFVAFNRLFPYSNPSFTCIFLSDIPNISPHHLLPVWRVWCQCHHYHCLYTFCAMCAVKPKSDTLYASQLCVL